VVVFWEHVVGLGLLIPFIVISWRQFKKLKPKQWWSITGVSLLSGALGTILYTSALAQVTFIPFSVVVLLQQLNPLFAITAATKTNKTTKAISKKPCDAKNPAVNNRLSPGKKNPNSSPDSAKTMANKPK
jgi:hypothetical protein